MHGQGLVTNTLSATRADHVTGNLDMSAVAHRTEKGRAQAHAGRVAHDPDLAAGARGPMLAALRTAWIWRLGSRPLRPSGREC